MRLHTLVFLAAVLSACGGKLYLGEKEGEGLEGKSDNAAMYICKKDPQRTIDGKDYEPICREANGDFTDPICLCDGVNFDPMLKDCSVQECEELNTGTVSGHVMDENGKPVDGATVSIGEQWDFTDVNGKFRLMLVPCGPQTLIVSKDNSAKKVDLTVEQDTIFDITLPIPSDGL